ncbi:MAG: FAD-dependent oxidoreductase [Synergistaceae bacterium]|jgi:protoporphyrinogen oxidase|nr:FAD-dependent oxidoreductase [Synergistaceae bacterium]
MKAAVLGAGVSGLTIARKLHDANADVTVYETDAKAGGLAKSRVTDGYIYDPHGGHIFNSKDKSVTDWVFSILPKEHWQYNIRNAKIFYKGKYISYPFELSLCELPIDDAVDCAYDFINAQCGDEPDNFADWLVWNFGRSIAEAYMLPYNRKIWAYPLEEMGTTWMRGKMPLPKKKDIIRSLALKDPTEREMPHSVFYYPIEGGIQTMVDAIAKPLTIRLSESVKSIESLGERWHVNGEMYDIVVSTIPLKILPEVMRLPEQVVSAINGLKYNSLTTFLTDCPPTNISWLYIPSARWRAHRMGYQSALTPKAAPNGGGSGAFEIIGAGEKADDTLIKQALPKELCVGHIIDTQFSEYAYVIHDKYHAKNVSVTRGYFDGSSGFYSIGRWGAWKYNNMDLCMAEAFDTAARILAHEGMV